ncbi:hypothetical protein F4859DRAFT_509962 [Xylaria cf. heliscus]|nr:hypothetical protein F4859DRAFT_509962 [Xylaria cf. heliscus]
MGERLNLCDDLARKQTEMLSTARALGRKLPGQVSGSSQTCNFTGYCVIEFVEAVPKALQEFRMLSDILMKSSERITEYWLTPEAMQAKTVKSKHWEDLESILYRGQAEQLKEALINKDRSMVVKGRLKNSTASPIVGVLVATKRTRADMENLEEHISALQHSALVASEVPRVMEEELQNATGDAYSYKLLCWGTDVAHLSAVSPAHDAALVKHTRGLREFWTIDAMGVMESERCKGVGKQMMEKVTEQAKAENLPILVCADRDAVPFYARCGFRNLDTFTFRGSEEGRSDAIMKWVWQATRAQ